MTTIIDLRALRHLHQLAVERQLVLLNTPTGGE
jgi:hypothetical protein